MKWFARKAVICIYDYAQISLTRAQVKATWDKILTYGEAAFTIKSDKQ